MRHLGWLAAAAWVGLAAAGSARAAPGLGETVYSPAIEDGETSVEIRGGRSLGKALDGDSGAVVELEHGFNDRFSAALLAEFEDEPGARRRLDSIGLEARAATGVLPVLDIETGLYAEYEQRLHHESGVGEFKLLLMKRQGPFEARANLIATHPFSQDDHVTEFGYAAAVDWRVRGPWRVGVETFGDLGRDAHWGGRLEHYVGPLVRTTIPLRHVGLKLEAAYLAAVGDPARRVADGQARFTVEIEKRW